MRHFFTTLVNFETHRHADPVACAPGFLGRMRGLAFQATMVALVGVVAAATTRADDAAPPVTIARGDTLAILVGPAAGAAEKRAAELLAELVKTRAGVAATIGDKAGAGPTIVLDVEPAPPGAARPADGYRIACDAAAKRWVVTGATPSGLVAGVGRLMRSMRFEADRVVVPTTTVADAPQMPNRGMYLWARKHYFNKPDQVDRYIEEFALWGGNAICFWFEMGMFETFADTTGTKSELDSRYAKQHLFDASAAREWIALYRRFYATARRMGMKTGLLMVANDAYMSSPKELRIKPIDACPDWYLCPSKPGAVEKMVAWQEEVFEALAPIDIYNIFPADSGGCDCDECQPWPTRGLWAVARPLAERIHEISPETEIWLDTWCLNHPTFGGKDWKNLVAGLDSSQERPEWFSGFEVGLAPNHRCNRLTAEERNCYNKAKQPLMVFPDISMWGNHPGMLVNTPYWKTLQDELNSYDPELMKGGWPYAERWNTDIATVMFLSWFWSPRKPVETILDDYAAFYFGPEAADARKLLDLLDEGNQDPERKAKIRELRTALDGRLPAWAKADWRWQEICLSCDRFTTP